MVEQPANLFTIAVKYAAITTRFIATNAASKTPFMVYLAFNHVHGPLTCGARWCGQSARGAIGDSVEETDWVIGEVMSSLRVGGGGWQSYCPAVVGTVLLPICP